MQFIYINTLIIKDDTVGMLHELITAGLEINLDIHPIIAGNGKPLHHIAVSRKGIYTNSHPSILNIKADI